MLNKGKGKDGDAPPLDLSTTDATRSTPRSAFVLSTILSFLPLINFSAWLLLMVTEGPKKRYWLYAALYGLPFILTAVGGLGGDALALEGAAVCAIHFQVERLALAVLDARAAAAEEEEKARSEGEVEGDAAAAEEAALEASLLETRASELAAFDARLGARLAKGGKLRALAVAAGVPRARSGRVSEVAAGLEAAVTTAGGRPRATEEGDAEDAPRHLFSVREQLIAEAQAALEKANNGSRRLKKK